MNSVSKAAESPKTGGKALDEDVVDGDAGVRLFAQDFEEAVELFGVFGVVGCVNDDLGKRGPRLKALPAMRALPWGDWGLWVFPVVSVGGPLLIGDVFGHCCCSIRMRCPEAIACVAVGLEVVVERSVRIDSE